MAVIVAVVFLTARFGAGSVAVTTFFVLFFRRLGGLDAMMRALQARVNRCKTLGLSTARDDIAPMAVVLVRQRSLTSSCFSTETCFRLRSVGGPMCESERVRLFGERVAHNEPGEVLGLP